MSSRKGRDFRFVGYPGCGRSWVEEVVDTISTISTPTHYV
jgi:hypothetical protein